MIAEHASEGMLPSLVRLYTPVSTKRQREIKIRVDAYPAGSREYVEWKTQLTTERVEAMCKNKKMAEQIVELETFDNLLLVVATIPSKEDRERTGFSDLVGLMFVETPQYDNFLKNSLSVGVRAYAYTRRELTRHPGDIDDKSFEETAEYKMFKLTEDEEINFYLHSACTVASADTGTLKGIGRAMLSEIAHYVNRAYVLPAAQVHAKRASSDPLALQRFESILKYACWINLISYREAKERWRRLNFLMHPILDYEGNVKIAANKQGIRSVFDTFTKMPQAGPSTYSVVVA